MNGLVALLGSGEYLPVMNAVDRFLLDAAAPAGKTPRVVCLPTAAGQEGEESWGRWMRMGEEHFRALGADVSGLPIVDRESAEDARFADQIAGADLIYFSGGKPGYLYETLRGSKAWEAVIKATGRGAAFAGCSAGAMFLGEFLPDMRSFGLRQQKAFGLLSKAHIFPHFDRIVTPGIGQPIGPARFPARLIARIVTPRRHQRHQRRHFVI